MIKVIVVTGYKSHELGLFDNDHQWVTYIKKAIEKKLIALLEEGLEWVIISGQLGVELWAAEVTLQLKVTYPDVKLAILTPFLQQEERWNEKTKAYYYEIYQQADFTDSISKQVYQSPRQLMVKNEFLIEKSDAMLVLYDEEKEGSPLYYLKVAKIKNEKGSYPIDYITAYDIDVVIQEELESDPNYWS